MGQVIAPNPLFASQAAQPSVLPNAYGILFNARSTSSTSHKVTVGQNAIVVKVFNISTFTLTVSMIGNDGITTVSGPLVINGKAVQLSQNNTSLILDMPGDYIFTLSGGVGTVSAIQYESGSAYWSYGLAAFAAAS